MPGGTYPARIAKPSSMSGDMMRRLQTFQDLFKRYRRPGDMVFALAFFAFSRM